MVKGCYSKVILHTAGSHFVTCPHVSIPRIFYRCRSSYLLETYEYAIPLSQNLTVNSGIILSKNEYIYIYNYLRSNIHASVA